MKKLKLLSAVTSVAFVITMMCAAFTANAAGDFTLKLGADKTEGLAIGDVINVTITPDDIAFEEGICTYDANKVTYDNTIFAFDAIEGVSVDNANFEVMANDVDGVISLMVTDKSARGAALKDGEGVTTLVFTVIAEAEETTISLAGSDISGTVANDALDGCSGAAGADLVLTFGSDVEPPVSSDDTPVSSGDDTPVSSGDDAPVSSEESVVEPTYSWQNIAPTGKVTVDSVSAQYGENKADFVNDGSMTTRWQSNAKMTEADPCWVALEFDAVEKINEVIIHWEAARADVNGYTVEYSLDGETWTAIDADAVRADTYKNADDKDVYKDTVSFEEIEAKFIRVFATQGEAWGDNGEVKDAASIWELEVMAYVEDGSVSVPDGPQTGVNSVALWVVITLAAAACITMTVVSKKATK